MEKINVYSHEEFDSICKKKGWDKNLPEGIAFISIIGNPDALDYYLEEPDTKHLLPSGPTVLNLCFDDISADTLTWKGTTFYGLTSEDASKAVDFIESNLGKIFYIHCRAGRSRSQAFARYLLDTYPENYPPGCTRPDNPPDTPNIDVLCKLKRAYREKE